MKKAFLFNYLLLYSTLAKNNEGPPMAKKISPPSPSPDSAKLPMFTWRNATSLHVTYPDYEEDTIHLHPSDTGGVHVKCLYEGSFSKEATASAVVSGCHGNSSLYITIYSSHLQTTVFTIRDNVTIEEINPYTNGEDSQPTRVKRSDFYYYSGEEEYVDLDFDDVLTKTPPNLLLKYRLGYDEGIKAHFGGNETAVLTYIINVATHASLHMKHSSLGVKIHMLRVGQPIFVQGKPLDMSTRAISRKSLTQVQSMKKVEPMPLIVFCKTDDLSTSIMGVAWPGYKGGACDEAKGAAIVKWRSSPTLAAVTFAHETGHLTGQMHDFREDEKNIKKDLYDPKNPCEGSGIMSRGDRGNRPEEWSTCSQERIKIWFANHGQCLIGLPDVQIFGLINNFQGEVIVKIENRYFTVEPRSKTAPDEGVILTSIDEKHIQLIDGVLKYGNSFYEEILVSPRNNIGNNVIVPGIYVWNNTIGQTSIIAISYVHQQTVAVKLTGKVHVPASELNFTVNKTTLKGFMTFSSKGFKNPYRHNIYLEQTGATSFKAVIKKKSKTDHYYLVNFMDEYNKLI